MSTPEGKMRDYLHRRCKKLGLKAFKMSFDGTRGAPDWFVAGMGKHIFVELKSEDGALSKPQERLLDFMCHAGGCSVFVCYEPEEIDSALKTMFSESDWLERSF